MSLKSCRWVTGIISTVSLILVAVCFFIDNQTLELSLLGGACVLVIAATVIRSIFWRCPQCGRVLSKGSPAHCSFCGWSEEE